MKCVQRAAPAMPAERAAGGSDPSGDRLLTRCIGFTRTPTIPGNPAKPLARQGSEGAPACTALSAGRQPRGLLVIVGSTYSSLDAAARSWPAADWAPPRLWLARSGGPLRCAVSSRSPPATAAAAWSASTPRHTRSGGCRRRRCLRPARSPHTHSHAAHVPAGSCPSSM